MKKTTIVTYPALITADENNTYDIEFIDVPEALSFGNSINDAVTHGQEALGLALYNHRSLPKPSDIQTMHKESNQIIVLVSVDLAIIKSKIKKPTVHKNVTVPTDLAEKAQQRGLNFSAILTEALKAKLDS
ncbi:HicB family protein [Pediococcus ethanolidurans]|uniref:type II toxin-antitoxin system HicB family antitoxin n=1 Tax=Pediococcus ethanolidurans TaxID=319653 RepID=UPI002953DEB3|nr:type II toxin-antitoxin system HicB family antitoxin [Pediococcus ethanolidurans]MDV7718695.1 HicB family protein [Pediococcus ethanolidurans]